MRNNDISESLQGGYGPYYNCVDGVTFIRCGIKMHIFIHEGFNAFGLIGTENNGIGMFSITSKDVVFADYLCRGMGFAYRQEKQVEIRRILDMSDEELTAFFEGMPKDCLRYNPLTAERKANMQKARIKKLDKKVAVSTAKRPLSFSAAEFMTAEEKEKTARDWELFIVNRLLLTREDAERAPLGAGFKPFTKRLYHHMYQHMGYIAHFNREGFFHAQMAETSQFLVNVQRIAEGEDGMGFTGLLYDRNYRDLNKAMQLVALHYLPEVKTLLEREDAEDRQQRIKAAKATLAKEGIEA